MDDINDGAFDYMLDMCEPSAPAQYKETFHGYDLYRDTLSAFRECFGFEDDNVVFDGVDYHPQSMTAEDLVEWRQHMLACHNTFFAAWAGREMVNALESDLCRMQSYKEEGDVPTYERAVDAAVKVQQYYDGEYSRAIIAFTQWMQDKMS